MVSNMPALFSLFEQARRSHAEKNRSVLGKQEQTLPAETGDALVSDISEPHGVRAQTDMRILATIAPPI